MHAAAPLWCPAGRPDSSPESCRWCPPAERPLPAAGGRRPAWYRAHPAESHPAGRYHSRSPAPAGAAPHSAGGPGLPERR